MASDVLLCHCTCPELDTAQQIAETLIGEQLAACVNMVPGIRSVYRWQGKVRTETEVLLLIKTTAGQFEAMKTRLLALHPYELPELIAQSLDLGHPTYLQWVRDSVAKSHGD